MISDKLFSIDGTDRVFQSDFDIKGKAYVRVFLDETGDLPTVWTTVNSDLYGIINNNVVFDIGGEPQGTQLVVQVATTPEELTSDPTSVVIVAGIKDEILAVESISGDIVSVANLEGEIVAIASSPLKDALLAVNEEPLRTAILEAEANGNKALDAWNDFQKRYYGTFSTDPSTDPLGNAPTEGDIYFNNTIDRLKVYTGGVWLEAGSSLSGIVEYSERVALAGQQLFSGLTYDVGYVNVYRNGYRLPNSAFVAIDGETVLLNTPCNEDDDILIEAFGAFDNNGLDDILTDIAQLQSDVVVNTQSILTINEAVSYTIDGRDIDVITTGGLYEVTNNLPETSTSGTATSGTLMVTNVNSLPEVRQYFRDYTTGSEFDRTSVLGDGSDWTNWSERISSKIVNSVLTKRYGVVSESADIISYNVDNSKFDVSEFTLYINNKEFKIEAQTIDMGLSAGQFKSIIVNDEGQIGYLLNDFPDDNELDTVIEIGRIASSNGTSITSLGSSAFSYTDILKNIYRRFKNYEGIMFKNGTMLVSENTTTNRALDLQGGQASTGDLNIKTLASRVASEGFPIYPISGVNGLRPIQTPLVVPNSVYSDGTDLIAIPSDNYVSHSLLFSPNTGRLYLEYGDTAFPRLQDALDSTPINNAFPDVGSEVALIAKIIMKEGDTNITQLVDLRNGRNNKVGDIAIQEDLIEFEGISLASSQQPSGTDIPLQIEFGPAQVGVNADLAIDGSVTIKTKGIYTFSALMHFGRTGGAGEAIIFGRVTKNNIQVDSTIRAVLDDGDFTFPSRQTKELLCEVGDIIRYEIVRDSSGNNSGGLFSASPTVSGWDISPSASIKVTKGQ